MGTAERVHEIAKTMGAKEVRIDASGHGTGVSDPLWDMPGRKYEIIEIWGSSTKAIDQRSYHNERAFRFSEMRRRVFQGLIDIDPQDENLIDELGGIQYEFSTFSGGMLIENKDSMKKRGVKSPDAADAASYACADLDYLLNDPFRGYEKGDVVQGENPHIESSWESELVKYSW
jgi:hypothetical protein